MVQHSMPMMLTFAKQGKITVENVIEKMAHNPAILFQIENRGFLCEGYQADIVLVHLNKPQTVSKDNILYKCGWSPIEGKELSATVVSTFINGNLAMHEGKIADQKF